MAVVTGDGTAVSGLGGPAGYGEIMLSRSDDASLRVDVGAVFETGFQFGANHFNADDLFVSTNGIVSFGAAVEGVQGNLSDITRPFIAAFHADIDTRIDGEGAESGPVWVDVDPISDVVTITWQEVGFYRRNASVTNTFQLQLYDQGASGFDIVLRYEEVGWTSGDLEGGWNGLGGVAALVGWRLSNSGAVGGDWASGLEDRLLALPDTLGNTGVAGLWVFSYMPPRVANGGAADDLLVGGRGNDTLDGGAGNDRLTGFGGADDLQGGTGFDLADYSQAASWVSVGLAAPGSNLGADALGDSFSSVEGVIGSAFADQLSDDGGDNLLDGGAGDDRLQDGAGDDTLIGGEGADLFVAGAGADHYFGGNGRDRLNYSEAATGVLLDRALPDASNGIATGDQLLSIEVISGSAFGDTLAGNERIDWLLGVGGDDNLLGHGGRDKLFGGEGDDTLAGGKRPDHLSGGEGRDMVSYAAATSFVHADLAGPTGNRGADARGDRYAGIEGLIGSGFNDTLAGNGRGNSLWGQAGDDRLTGRSGNDTLRGGAGADLLVGGGGFDWADYTESFGGVIASLAKPSLNSGDARGDRFARIEGLRGSEHADQFHGNDMANRIEGMGGEDQLYGRAGDDTLFGGEGKDWLGGGGGGDCFVIQSLNEAGDYIKDYAPGEGDWIEITEADIARADIQVSFETLAGQGRADRAEALVIHRPSGLVLFTLVDAGGLTELILRLGATTYDLL